MKCLKPSVLLVLGVLALPVATGYSAERAPAHPAQQAGAAQAALQGADVKAIQAAVQEQLDAFAQEDGDKAFDLSSTDTRTRFGSSDNFLRVVKKHYTPIYRHRLAHFSAPELLDGEVYQLVDLIDENNKVWVAVYRMERDDQGRWKIDGCQLHETDAISI